MHIRKLLTGFICLFAVVLTLLLIYPVGYFVLDSNCRAPFKELDAQVIPGTVGAYVINLERSKERYDYVKNNIEALGVQVERISAIDGNALTDVEISEKADLKTYKQFLGHLPKLGTIGCSLSHIKAWQTFLDSNFEFAIIFEDDVSFEPTKLKSTITQLIEDKKLWDINNFETAHGGTPLSIKSFSDGQKLVVYLTEVSHAGAYMINREAAHKLLEKALPIKMPIDHYFTRVWEFDLKFTGIENPRLVYQTFGSSEIAQTKKLTQEKLPISHEIKRGIYKFQSYVMRFLYNFKVYLREK